METRKINDLAAKIIGFLGCAMLTIFAGMFALSAIGTLVISIIDKCFFTTIACAACAFIAWCLWSVRKDVLV